MSRRGRGCAHESIIFKKKTNMVFTTLGLEPPINND